MNGATVFTGDDIRAGQEIFLKYGLMENGTIWGHGAYLGPDFSAEYLHTLGLDIAAVVSDQRYGKPLDALMPDERAAVDAAIVSEMKRLAVPASVDSIPSSAMQEDHVSMGWSAARKLRRSVDGLARVVAIEYLTAARALDLRAPLTPSPATGAALALLRRNVGRRGRKQRLVGQQCRRQPRQPRHDALLVVGLLVERGKRRRDTRFA